MTHATERRQGAAQIASALASSPGVDGVYLYGSVARGDATAQSDIDLIVVGDRAHLSSRKVRALVPAKFQPLRPAISFYTQGELELLLSAKASFAHHLATEGEILFDPRGILRELIGNHRDRNFEVGAEVDFELKRLANFEDTSQFNGNFLFCLANLYMIGKSIVMLALAADHEPQYNKDRAFTVLSVHKPDLREDIDSIAKLKPFYLRVTGRDRVAFPFPYRGAERQVREAIQSIRRIAAAAR